MLMYASWTGNLETVRFLLSSGANVNLRSKEGKTAIAFAQELRQQYQGMVDFTSHQDYPKFLGDPKAARAVYMETVWRCDAVIEYLRQHGADE